MSPDTLRESVRKYWRAVAIVYLPGIAVSLLLLGTLSRILAVALEAIGMHISPNSLGMAPLLIPAVPLMALLFYIQRRVLSRCPRCGSIIYPSKVERVIASKCCTECAQAIVPK